MNMSGDSDKGEAWHQAAHFQRYWQHYQSMHDWYNKQVKPTQQQDANQLRLFMDWCRSMHTYHKQYADYMLRYSQYYSQLASGRDGSVKSPSTSRPTNPTPRSAQREPPAHGKRHGQSAANRRRQHRRERSRRTKRRKMALSNCGSVPCQVEVRVQGDLETYDDIDVESDSSHDQYEFEMEITDDMMEFFTQSAKHRKERGTIF